MRGRLSPAKLVSRAYSLVSRSSVVGLLVIGTVLCRLASNTIQHRANDPRPQGGQLMSRSPGDLSLRVLRPDHHQHTIYLLAENRRLWNHEYRWGIENDNVETFREGL